MSFNWWLLLLPLLPYLHYLPPRRVSDAYTGDTDDVNDDTEADNEVTENGDELEEWEYEEDEGSEGKDEYEYEDDDDEAGKGGRISGAKIANEASAAEVPILEDKQIAEVDQQLPEQS